MNRFLDRAKRFAARLMGKAEERPTLPTTPMSEVDLLRAERSAAIKRAVEAYEVGKATAAGAVVPFKVPLLPYVPPPGICPSDTLVLANDRAWREMANDATFALVGGISTELVNGIGFPGFAFLTELTQLTEYRDISERTASEMTRRWVKLKTTSDEDRSQVLEDLENDMKRFGIRDLFREAAKLDGFMGRAQLYVDIEGADEPGELSKPLFLLKYKIKKGSLRGFKLVEPITTYPASYNSTNPLAADYYVPKTWFVYGTEVHATRLLTFVSRPLPNMLKPVYNFSGMSLSQLAIPYVDYWLGTRDSVGRLIRNFSIIALGTDLDVLLSPAGDELVRRVELFSAQRDNQGVFLFNEGKESVTQTSVPISGLDHLQAQAQEHMAAVAKTPLTVLLGITPTGLNSTSDSDLRIYYDYVADQQEILFRRNLETVLKIMMLSRYGEVYDDVTFDFVSLYAPTDKETADLNKVKADTDAVLIDKGIIEPAESRTRLAKDADSGYNSLDLEKQIAPPEGSMPGEPPPGGVSDEDFNPSLVEA